MTATHTRGSWALVLLLAAVGCRQAPPDAGAGPAKPPATPRATAGVAAEPEGPMDQTLKRVAHFGGSPLLADAEAKVVAITPQGELAATGAVGRTWLQTRRGDSATARRFSAPALGILGRTSDESSPLELHCYCAMILGSSRSVWYQLCTKGGFRWGHTVLSGYYRGPLTFGVDSLHACAYNEPGMAMGNDLFVAKLVL